MSSYSCQLVVLVLLALLCCFVYSEVIETHVDGSQTLSNEEQVNIDQLIQSKTSKWFRSRLEKRLSEYVQIDTQSDPHSTTVPSTKKQFALSDYLLKELRSLGLENTEIDQYGNVYAKLVGNSKKADKVTTLAFLAHLDTSPEISGENVSPMIHRNYKVGENLIVKETNKVIVDFEKNKEILKEMAGHDIMTSSTGVTLLGADDKAGIAEIMTAIEFLQLVKKNSQSTTGKVPQFGNLSFAFTIDEEIGRGPKYIDISKINSTFAFTVDGDVAGKYNVETFSADLATITFYGINTHPGMANHRMVNALKLSGYFLDNLPDRKDTPEFSKDKEGFVHCIDVKGGVEKIVVRCIIRSFEDDEMIRLRKVLEDLVSETKQHFIKFNTENGLPTDFNIDIQFVEQYRNMKKIIDKYPIIEKNIIKAYKEVLGKEEEHKIGSVAIRGGTDGSQLSWMGLPTANIFTGGRNYHSTDELVSIDEMEMSTRIIIKLAEIFEEQV
ncbi:hypothetical protein ABK040_009008 [Willaertia magna]